MTRFRLQGLVLSLLLAACAAHAEILVGQTADFTGPTAVGVTTTRAPKARSK